MKDDDNVLEGDIIGESYFAFQTESASLCVQSSSYINLVVVFDLQDFRVKFVQATDVLRRRGGNLWEFVREGGLLQAADFGVCGNATNFPSTVQ